MIPALPVDDPRGNASRAFTAARSSIPAPLSLNATAHPTGSGAAATTIRAVRHLSNDRALSGDRPQKPSAEGHAAPPSMGRAEVCTKLARRKSGTSHRRESYAKEDEEDFREA